MLGSQGVIDAMGRGDIKISPFNHESLQPNSYDVALDRWYYTLIESIGRNPLVFVRPNDLSIENLYSGVNVTVRDGERVVEVRPYGMILAATIEVIGAFRGFTTLLKAKSTISRLGLDVCASAGFGDVGFVNKWTLEIRNNTDRRFIIPVGTKIAQVSFLPIEGEGHVYTGSYLQRKEWNPEQMLPKVKPKMFLKV